MMKQFSVGILAHVDAGKTTLSESLLYESGMIKKLGRVDNQDAFLDTNELERQRGITIFSKQAIMKTEDTIITLLDTPGHVDFSAEMERTLWVMDYAILVINGADGIQGHTLTLWRLLERYQIPTFIFVNKMDQIGTNQEQLQKELCEQFGEGCVDFTSLDDAMREEQIAVCDDALMVRYLDGGRIEDEDVRGLIAERKLFPCYFGSALKLINVDCFFRDIMHFMKDDSSKKDGFGAKVFKISRDLQGNRLTYLKVTNGTLNVKDVVSDDEKVNQIRIYSGDKFDSLMEAAAGTVCAVTGLSKTYPGQGLGVEVDASMPMLEPVLTYKVRFLEDVDAATMLPLFKQLEEEEPALHVVWQEETKSIQLKLMGEVQIDVIKNIMQNRFGVLVEFGAGDIVYKETITNVVEGVGHFEPLRHYAEVHLLMEPGEIGSGMQFLTNCSEDVLDKNWQRLILTHLEEKEHVGVLLGTATYRYAFYRCRRKSSYKAYRRWRF